MADSSDFNVDINHNITSQTGTNNDNIVKLSSQDRAIQNKLITEMSGLRQLLGTTVHKDIVSTVTSALAKSGLLSQKQLGTASAITDKAFATAIASAITRSQKQPFGSSVKGQGTSAFGDPATFIRMFKSSLDSAVNTIAIQFEKSGIKVDPEIKKLLKDIAVSRVSGVGTKNTQQVIKELASTVKSLQSLGTRGLQAFTSAKKLSTSGGKIEFKELKPVLEFVKSGTNDLSKVLGEIKSVSDNMKKLPAAYIEQGKSVLNELNAIKKSLSSKVGSARRTIAEDPMSAIRDMTRQIVNETRKATPGLGDSKAIKVLERLSDSATSYKQVEGALNDLADSFKALIAKDSSKLQPVQDLVAKFKVAAEAIPFDLDIGKITGPAYPKFIKKMEGTVASVNNAVAILNSVFDNFTKATKKPLILPIKPEIDTTAIDAIKKKGVEIPASLLLDTKDLLKLSSSAMSNSPHQRIMAAGKSEDISKSKSPYTLDEVVKTNKEVASLLTALVSELGKFVKLSRAAGPTGGADKNVAYGNELIKTIEENRSNPIDLLKVIRGIISSKDRSAQDLVQSGMTKDGTHVKNVLNDLNKLISTFDAGAMKNAMASSKADPFVGGTIARANNRSFGPATQESVYTYRPKKLLPSRDTRVPLGTGVEVSAAGEESRKAVEANVKGLTNSLLNLQHYVVSTLDKGFEASESNWAIVRSHKEQNISEYFKLTQGYNKKTSGKQYSVKIADVASLQRELGGKKVLDKQYGLTGKQSRNPESLISAFKEKTFTDAMRADVKRLPELIGKWIKRFSEQDIATWEGLDKTTAEYLVDLKTSTKAFKGAQPSKKLINELGKLDTSDLENIYRKTINEIESNEQLRTTKEGNYAPLVRDVSIPAASLSSTGASIFETQQGSQRVIPKFAKYQTGFESLYSKLAETKTLDITKDYQSSIKKLGIRPSGKQFNQANVLATSMLTDLANPADNADIIRKDILKQIRSAGVLRSGELQRQGHITSKETNFGQVDEILAAAEPAFVSGSMGLDELLTAVKAVGISAYDVAKSMETVEFKNIYEMFEQLLRGSNEYNKALETLASTPNYDASIREYETYMRKLVGTIPIADPARPRRYAHQEKIVNLMSMTSPVYDEGTKGMTSDARKQYIRDLNLNLKGFVKDSVNLETAGVSGRNLPSDVRTISSLGVPESQAATLAEFRYKPGNKDNNYLSAFNATNLKMYTDILPEMAPFGAQFQQLGRNIASTTNALAYRPAGQMGTDFPGLRSERENQAIAGGRYGDQGYGFNVVAELRNTASTFEDQIVISGKLADVLTSVTKTLVQPDKLGKLNFFGPGITDPSSGKVEDIKPGPLKGIENANKVFQKVLGVKQEYRGRADEALIEEVIKAITVVRGQDINVQVAKIAETFFNHYGRKFTTRYGSKGVSISPTGGGELTGEQIAKLYDKPVKVLSEEERGKAGLGTALLPKSMGELLREVFISKRKDLDMDSGDFTSLNQEMVKSGNKFILSMFTDASLGVVPGFEAEAQQILFGKVNKALASLNLSIGKDVEGVEGVKSIYGAEVDKPLFKEKPIDIRISSFGIAKRGLQTENLETIMNNVISAGESGATVLNTEFDPTVYRKLLGTSEESDKRFPSLSKISEALGFESAKGDKADITKDLFELLKFKDTKGTDQELMAQASKLADLEIKSNFYSSAIDEFGTKRQSLIGPKFVEVVEDPHANPAWSETDIAKQIKGERLNIPAYGAYASIFGKGSAFLKQMSGSTPLDTKKNYEYIKALQMLTDSTTTMSVNLLKAAKQLDVKDLKTFYPSTGTFAPDKADAANSLLGTVLDVKQFPSALNLQIPSTRRPEERESFYVPGALARTTYPEPTMAGEFGLDNISRRLQQVVNSAKNVDALLSGDADEDTTSKTVGRIKKRLSNLRKEVEGRATTGIKGGKLQFKDELAPEDIKRFDEILGGFSGLLTSFPVAHTAFNVKPQTRQSYVEGFAADQFGKNSPAEAYTNIINAAVDQIIGLNPKERDKAPDRFKPRYDAPTILSQKQAIGGEAVKQLAGQLNIEPAKPREDALKRGLEGLEKAKIEYYNALAQATLGKTGAVQEFMFTRKIPAVMAKAINAVVDKTSDLEKFSAELLQISESSDGMGNKLDSLKAASKAIDTINKKHTKSVSASKAKGLPVLKQDELGIPENYARNLPTFFRRKYSFNEKKGTVSELQKPKLDKSNLANMMKYRDEMLKALETADPMTKKSISSHIGMDLTPYIESTRYPFTGISSVQPFKAKVLRPGKDRQLERHSLMVPGIPDMDIAAFDKVKKQVSATRDVLYKDLDKEQAKEVPDINIVENLIKTIGRLDKAISDVIPKYVAQQQKLDFDGDQIEIHSAKTMAARKEIEQHFKSTTEHGFSKSTTAQVFRDKFTYGASKDYQPTGKYTLAEQQLAFQKKFPEKEGFGFMTKPFLTEQLEYLSDEERLGILSSAPGGGGVPKGPAQVLTDVLPEIFRNQDTIDNVMAAIKSVEAPLESGGVDDSVYISALLSAIGKLDNNILNIVNKGVTSELFDTKYLSTISAQLFKINTGPDTEALNRLLKIFERNTGFGSGMIGQSGSQFEFSDALERRFPTDLKVLGNSMGEELNVMINELVRVGIQKGLDVKHAADIPIATEMASLIAQGTPGASKLSEKIAVGEGAYGDIKDFAEANKQALGRSLSKMSTEDLRFDAMKLAEGRGQSKLSLMDTGREELTQYIISAIGFDGFLQELSTQVMEAAYEGIMKDVETWDPSVRATKLQGSTPKQYAKKQINKQMTEEGQVNVLESAQKPLLPLYGYRTSGASGYSQRERYKTRYKDPQISELEGIFEPGSKLEGDMQKKYKEAKAVAQNLHDDLSTFSSSSDERRDSYSLMLQSTIKNLRDDQQVINDLNTELEKEGDFTDTSVVDRLAGKAPMNTLTAKILSQPTNEETKKLLEKYGRQVGVPSLNESSIRTFTNELSGPVGEYVQAKAPAPPKQGSATDKEFDAILKAYNVEQAVALKKALNKAIAIAQTDMILEVAKIKGPEKGFLKEFIPIPSGTDTKSSFSRNRQKISDAARMRLMEGSTGTEDLDIGMMSQGMASGGGPPSGFSSQVLRSYGGKPVDVFVVGVAQGVGLVLGEAKGYAQTTEAPFRKAGIPEDLKAKIREAQTIVENITGGLNSLQGSDFGIKYRASGLKGVSDPNKQFNEIKKIMTGEGDINNRLSSSSLLGTGIHAKLERSYLKDPAAAAAGLTTLTETPTRYDDPVVGEISGTMDVIRKDQAGTTQQIIDIKTTSERNFGVLSRAISDFREETGKETPSLQEIIPFIKGKKNKYLREDKMGEVMSQLNLYLKAENEKATAFAHFYSAENTDFENPLELSHMFDPKRLSRDVEAIRGARASVRGEGKPFAKTASYEEASAIQAATPSDEEIEKLIKSATEYYKLVQSNQGLASDKPSLDDEDLKNIAANTRKQRARMTAWDDMLRVNPVAEGSGVVGIQRGLFDMHQVASSAQRAQGIDIDSEGFQQFHPGVQEQLTQILKEGRAGHRMSSVLTELQDTGEITQQEVTKAWKAYRIAVGDYYIKMIEAAQANLKDEKLELGSSDAIRKFDIYKNLTKNFQAFAKDSLGKKTDIYTQDHRYIAPDAARQAGVLMSSQDLINKAADPLEEDRDLKAVFERMVDLDKGQLPLPRESIREALTTLLGMDKSLISIYTSAEKVLKLGTDINSAWNFSKARSGISRLREQLEKMLSYNTKDIYSADQLTYLKNVLTDLRNIEKVYSRIDFESIAAGPTTGQHEFPDLLPVNKSFNIDEQLALNNTNLAYLERYFQTLESKGGPRKGETFNYEAKTFGPAGRTSTNKRYSFIKYGEVLDSAGKKTSVFDKNMKDLGKTMAEGNRTFKIAVERVIKWGAAATLVYGGISYIKEAVNHISDVEVAMARLQMVMNPLDTDFNRLKMSAIGFAKEYGVSVESVLAGMRIFAQQGLGEQGVLDRTRTSVVASNITDLSAADATEALTAAMKVFRSEGEQSMRFLDSWSQVESKAAVTAGNLADAIKKSASAASNAGISFDQLNGMVAAIGSVTRQTGKEVGTSLRFIFRRLSSDKGPKALAEQDVKILGKGDLRPGFDILGDLAERWDDLSRAQKLSLAQAIGGTRQYNQVLVLMDNWDEVLRSVGNSMDSKGAAERKNLVLMQTYAKQLEQTKAVFSELKLEIGKVVLPSFKVGLAGLRGLIETINNVPPSIKLAGAGLLLFAGYVTKGAAVIDGFMKMMDKSKITFGEFKDDLSKGFNVGMFELFGKGSPETNADLFGTKSIKSGAIKDISDLDSSMGKLGFSVISLGRVFNEFLGVVGNDTGKATEAVGKFIGRAGDLVQGAGIAGATVVGPFIPGMVDEAVSTGVAFTGDLLQGGGKSVQKAGEFLGAGAGNWLESFASDNSSALKSLAPLVGAMAGLAILLPSLKKAYGGLALSAEAYKKQQYSLIDSNQTEIEAVQSLIQEYDALDKQLKRIDKLSKPSVQEKGAAIGDYKSPLLAEIKYQEKLEKFKTSLASTDTTFLVGVDDLGKPMLKGVGNLKEYLSELERIKKVQNAMLQVDVIGKFADELTTTDGIQEWKYQLKELAQAVPLIGEMMGKGISVGPKKALEVIGKEINALLGAKGDNPLSTAFDADIKKAFIAQAKVRSMFDDSYLGMTKSIESLNLSGIDATNLVRIFNTDNMQKALDLVSEVETKYNSLSTRGKVSGSDLATSKLLGETVPSLAGYIEPLPELTLAKAMEAGINPRNISGASTKAVSGDFAILNEEFAEQYGISTRQAILKIDAENNVFFKYFDEHLKRWNITPSFSASDIQDNVQALFPVNEIIKGAEEELAKLNTFAVGASAGIVGFSDKTLATRGVDFGEKFYSDIPTEVLLQTNKGYNPNTRTFGDQAYKKDYKEEFNKYFYKPSHDFSEQLKALRADTSEPGDITRGLLGDELKELQEVLANNSIVFQYRIAIEDLHKALEESARTLDKRIAIERSRQRVDKEDRGLLAGITKGIVGQDLGIQNYDELNADQLSAISSPIYRDNAKELLYLDIQSQTFKSDLETIIGTLSDLDKIGGPSKAFGSLLSPDEIISKNKLVDAAGGDKGAAEIAMRVDKLVTPAMETAANTAMIAGILSGTPKKTEKLQETILSPLDSLEKGTLGRSTKGRGNLLQLTSTLNKLDKQRLKASNAGDTKLVAQIDSSMNTAYSRIIDKVGIENIASGAVPGIRKGDRAKVLTRGLAGKGLSFDALIKGVEALRSTLNNDWKRGVEMQRELASSDFKDTTPEIIKKRFEEARQLKSNKSFTSSAEALKGYYKVQGDSKAGSRIDADKVGKYALMSAVYAGFKKVSYGENYEKVNERIDTLIDKRDKFKKTGIPTTEIDKKITAAQNLSERIQKRKQMTGTLQGLTGTAAAAITVGKGVAPTDSGKLKLAATALGVYSIMKLMGTSGRTESAKKYIKEFEKSAGESLKKAYESKDPSKLVGSYKAAKQFTKEFVADKSREKVTGITDKEMSESVTAKKDALRAAISQAEIDKMQRELSSEIDATGKGGTRDVAAMIAAGIAGTLYQYVGGDGGIDEKIAEGTKTADKEAQFQLQYIKENAELIDQFLQSSTAVKAQEQAGGSKVIDNLFMSAMDELASTRSQGLEDKEVTERVFQRLQKEIDELAIDNAIIQSFNAFRIAIDGIYTGLKKSVRDFDTQRIFNPVKSVGNVLKGYTGELQLPVTRDKMNASQRSFVDSADSVKDAYAHYKKLNMALTAQVQIITNYEDRIAQLNTNLVRTEGTIGATDSRVGGWRKSLVILEEQLEKAKEHTNELNSSIIELGTAISNLQDFRAAVYELNDALKSSSIQDYTQSAAGLKSYFDTVDNLIGGSGVNALRVTTPEQQRRASEIGINLGSTATSQELEKAELQRKLSGRDGTLSSEEYRTTKQQLFDLPAKYEALDFEKRQITENQANEAALQPYTKIFSDLELILRSNALTPEQETQAISLQDKIARALDDAFTPITREQRKGELKTQLDAGQLSPMLYDKKIKQLDLGPDKVYRGVSDDLKSAIKEYDSGLASTIEDYMAATGQTRLTGESIYEPIVSQLKIVDDSINHISEALGKPNPLYNLNRPEERTSPGMKGIQRPVEIESISNPPAPSLSEVKDWMDKHKTDLLNPAKSLKTPSDDYKRKDWTFFNTMRYGQHPKKDEFSSVFGNLQPWWPTEAKATGGRIFGEGGPREDKVPAYLSPGEFVIRSHSAQRIGYDALNHMNKKGNVPSFGSGGALTKQHIAGAKAYFNDDDAELPDIFNPESKLFNKKVSSQYLKYYKQTLPLDVQEREDVQGVKTLKGLYNKMFDVSDEGEHSDKSLFLEDYSVLIKRVTEANKKKAPLLQRWAEKNLRGNKSKATLGVKAVTGILGSEALEEKDGGLIPRFESGGLLESIASSKGAKYASEKIQEIQALLKKVYSDWAESNQSTDSKDIFSINKAKNIFNAKQDQLKEVTDTFADGGMAKDKDASMIERLIKVYRDWMESKQALNSEDVFSIDKAKNILKDKQDRLKKVTDTFAGGGPVKSFVGVGNDIRQISSEEFDRYVANKGRGVLGAKTLSNSRQTGSLWGAETAKSVHQNILGSKFSERNSEKYKARKQFEAESFYKTIESLNAAQGVNPRSQSTTFNSRTGVKSAAIPYFNGKFLNKGYQTKESYRNVDQAYRPNYARATKSNIITPGGPSTIQSKDLFNFRKRLPTNAPSDILQYHEYARNIQEHIDRMTQLPEEYVQAKKSGEYAAQVKALEAAKNVLRIAQSGGNIFTDKRLHKRELVDNEGQMDGLFGLYDFNRLFKDTTYLQDIREAFDRAALDRYDSGKEGILDPVTGRAMSSADYYKKKADGGSLSVFHNGGFVRDTGPVFAQKGELIIPKRFADGTSVDIRGQASNTTSPASSSLKNNMMISLDGTEILDKLNSLELNVKKDPIPVDVKNLEEITLKVEDKAVTIDATKAASAMTDAVSSAISSLPVKLDIGDADTRLANAIATAITQSEIKVQAASAPDAAGSDVFDLVENFKDQFLTATVKIEDKVSILEEKVDTIDSGQTVNSKLDGIQQDLAANSSSIDRLDDKVTSYINRASQDIAEARRIGQEARNFTGTGK